MTDEEKAKEYTDNINTIIYDIDDNAINIAKYLRKAYLDGLAEERKEKWHDLRKNPEDLPKKHGEYITNIGLLYYDELCGRSFWHTPSCEACDYSDEVGADEVIAWCEIPKFEG